MYVCLHAHWEFKKKNKLSEPNKRCVPAFTHRTVRYLNEMKYRLFWLMPNQCESLIYLQLLCASEKQKNDEKKL